MKLRQRFIICFSSYFVFALFCERVNKLRKEKEEEKFEYLLRLKKTSFSYSSSSPPISCRFPFVFRVSTNLFRSRNFLLGNYLLRAINRCKKDEQ